MARKKLTKEESLELERKKLIKLQFDTRHRTREHDKIQIWCNKRGLTIYAACQKNLKIRLFKQVGEGFLPLNDNEYDQYDEADKWAVLYEIRQGYLRYYNKFKDK